MDRLKAWLRRVFTDFDQETEARVKEQEEQRIQRLLHSPIFFATWGDFVKFRRKHGLRTRGGGWLNRRGR